MLHVGVTCAPSSCSKGLWARFSAVDHLLVGLFAEIRPATRSPLGGGRPPLLEADAGLGDLQAVLGRLLAPGRRSRRAPRLEERRGIRQRGCGSHVGAPRSSCTCARDAGCRWFSPRLDVRFNAQEDCFMQYAGRCQSYASCASSKSIDPRPEVQTLWRSSTPPWCHTRGSTGLEITAS